MRSLGVYISPNLLNPGLCFHMSPNESVMRELTPQELQEARELRVYLRTVGDVIRLEILRQLAQNEEMSVRELVSVLRVSQPLVSWHLGVMKRIALVNTRKEGRLVYFTLNRDVLRSFRRRFDAWIQEINKSGGKDHDDQTLE
jgi:DNA-binding transcriptional ArsR family regulator